MACDAIMEPRDRGAPKDTPSERERKAREKAAATLEQAAGTGDD